MGPPWSQTYILVRLFLYRLLRSLSVAVRPVGVARPLAPPPPALLLGQNVGWAEVPVAAAPAGFRTAAAAEARRGGPVIRYQMKEIFPLSADSQKDMI